MDKGSYFQRPRLAQGMSIALLALLWWPHLVEAYTPLSTAREERKIKVNSTVITMVADHPDSTLMKIADDLAIVISDLDSMRVVPIVGDGAAGNVRDVVFLRNIDMGLTDLATLEHLKQTGEAGFDIANEIAYIAPLFDDKIQILARRGIKTLKQLEGRRVNVGLAGSGAAIHAKKILEAFDITAKISQTAQPDAVEMLIKGDIDAIVCFCLGSPGLYQRVMFNYDLHLLAIPWTDRLPPQYTPAKLTQQDYPAFIAKNKTVSTIAVSIVLVTYNWRKGDPRYERVASFVKRFFDRFSKLQEAPPRHIAWKTVSTSALLPGWKQFEAANAWIVASKQTVSHRNLQLVFEEYLDQWTSENSPPNQQNKLFEEFLTWQESRR
ncbi:MAG: TAXI family TRAP transporter solute-binding subunit [Hyphomicrobiales bacterium]|nr:TAXI family TRAP transporter solute-binding subunit [Hyphomicrobiales bacterium]